MSSEIASEVRLVAMTARDAKRLRTLHRGMPDSRAGAMAKRLIDAFESGVTEEEALATKDSLRNGFVHNECGKDDCDACGACPVCSLLVKLRSAFNPHSSS